MSSEATADQRSSRFDVLITNATVLTVDASDTVLSGASIGVSSGRIAAVGTVEPDAAARAVRVVDAQGAIVLPGFVNLHTHLAMTLFRGYADDRDLQAFLDRLFPAEAKAVSPEMVRVGAELAFAESIQAGITTSADMYFHPEVAGDAARRAGVRIANGPVVFSFTGPDNVAYDDRMADAERSLAAARRQGELTAGRWLCPHSAYTVNVEHLEACRDLAARTGAGIHIHAAENQAEVDTVVASTRRRPVELLDDIGMLCAQTLLAHAVELTDHEIDRITRTGASVAHNPLSNMKLASGFARIPDLVRAGACVGLGTDGTASSNDLDLYAAIRFAATIHKARTNDATALPSRSVLRMATIDGARALGVGDQLGSIEVGKRADLQILRADRPNLVPSYDPISTVVFAAGRSDVRSVMVEGRFVLDDGALTTLDLTTVLASAQKMAERIRELS